MYLYAERTIRTVGAAVPRTPRRCPAGQTRWANFRLRFASAQECPWVSLRSTGPRSAASEVSLFPLYEFGSTSTNSTLRQIPSCSMNFNNLLKQTKKTLAGAKQPLGLNSYTNQARAKLKLGNRNRLCHHISRIIMSADLAYL